ncbi:MAG: alginate export family protein [Deltaproteobacteria bacterium]|nr:alginate export family protein [Deltaproteobacteria bacterium]MBW2530964.1 alginate export family protein [Deltaproteobacteria bacterium]
MGIVALAAPSWAQLETLDEGVSVGDWTFRPTIDLRIRGEYRHNPPTTGGDVYTTTAVLVPDATDGQPPVGRVSDQWLVAERTRLGLTAEWESLTAAVVLEDARGLGIVPGAPAGLDEGGFGALTPFEAYLAVTLPDPAEEEDWQFRLSLGRQQVVWGDGRLLGESDWAHRGYSLDAGRIAMRFDDVEIDTLAALLSLPGALPPEATSEPPEAAADGSSGTGAQLYGLDVTWHALDLLRVELTGLARIVREPAVAGMTPGDTYVIDGRIFGDHRGVRYSAQGAYQLGRVATIGAVRDLSAFAFAVDAAWLTALPLDLELGVEGSYASGQDAAEPLDSTFHRFDPLVPEVHDHHDMMDLAAWSNSIAAGGFVAASPFEEGRLRLGFTFLGLAEPTGQWTTGGLIPVGADPANESHVLGYEGDLRFTVVPWDPLALEAGYGLFLSGAGAKAILAAAGRGEPDLLHFGYLQARLQAP